MEYVPPLANPDPPDHYRDADPGGGEEGSLVPAAALEDPQREIVAAIEGAGLTPDDEDLTQLWQAIQSVQQVPTGTIISFAGPVTPTGYLLCAGAAISRTGYAALFAVIGTVWGVGDGSTTFNLPDLRGRDLIGVGQGSGLTNRSLADTGGEEDHTLTESEMPSHTHDAIASNVAGVAGHFAFGQFDSGTETTEATGDDQPHNNMQPFAAVNFVIKT